MAAIVMLIGVAAFFVFPGFAGGIIAVVLILLVAGAFYGHKSSGQASQTQTRAVHRDNAQSNPNISSLEKVPQDDRYRDQYEQATSHKDTANTKHESHITDDWPFSSDKSPEDYFEDFKKRQAVEDKWAVIVNEHRRLETEIGIAYTIANNLQLPDSPEMQHVIDLCMQDIAIAEMYKRYCIERTEVLIETGCTNPEKAPTSLPIYMSFKRLAIIYEKQKDYDNGIAVCQRAIDIGYIYDGTEGQMPGRLARLMRKKNNKSGRVSSTTAKQKESAIAAEFSDSSFAE